MSLRLDKGKLVFLLAGCCLALAVWPAAADNWPRFRGPNGTGVTADPNVPLQWNDKEGVAWKTPLPGTGNSSPVVWGEHVFVQSATEDGKERMLLCLSAADGKILWSRSIPGVPFKFVNKYNTYASCTPAVDGERVYNIFWDGVGETVHAYDFKGNLLWQYNLGPFKSQHGAGASPIVYDGKVIINHDQDGAAVVIALDAKTGKPVWQAKREGVRVCYSVPFLLERPGEPVQLIVASTPGITAYNPADGTELWTYHWTFSGMRLRTVGSPLYHQGLIFATSGDGSGLRHMIAVKAGGKGDVSQTHLAWQSQDRALLPYVPTILAHGDHLYYVNDAGLACCVEAKSGKVVWKERMGGEVSASPVLIDGKVVAVDREGEVYVFAASPAGFKLLAKNSLGESTRATPAVADGRLFFRGAKHLFCIAKAAGKSK
jgi:outer membrane protein assembly factor BamB